MASSNVATFVLVHGSWHGGWCWQKLLPFLETDGSRVFTPTLTGMGERKHLASPATGLSQHVEDVTNVLEYEDLHDVILVGHSYAGLVISGVAEHSDRVGKLVFLDGIVPEHGESMFSIIPGLQEDFESTADSQGLVPPWEPESFGVVEPEDLAWMTPRLTPMPILTHAERLDAPLMKAKTLPRSFIHCTQFGLGGFAELMRSEGGHVYTLDCGHDAMVIQPAELAEVLRKHV
ncbi:MAG TPA: alpha/beta fold hydrolase [Dehalococcoidia bacterium]|nr:alpha/beta fold hydrolase [Dehalococcoidia bacterium]